MKIVVRAALSPYIGYGNDGIGLVKALAELGHDVRLAPTLVETPIPAKVADLLTVQPTAPYDLLLGQVDPFAFYVTDSERAATTLTVNWTMWEFTDLDIAPKKMKRTAVSSADVVLAYDAVTKQALEPHRKGKPIETCQGGYDPEGWEVADRDWDGPFRFCMVGALHRRKDPWVAVEAFRQLKAEGYLADAELHLKTQHESNIPPNLEDYVPKARMHYGIWPIERLRAFYAGCHVLLAPSRGEGKNVPALEFMTTGGTVIATNWGGHTGWLTNDIGYPLDYSLRPCEEGKNAMEARANIHHLKLLMRRAYTCRDEVRRKGEIAAKIIPETMSWKVKANDAIMLLQAYIEGRAENRPSD